MPEKVAAPLLGQRLKRQRRAHAPLPAHRNPEQRAQHQQHVQRRRKRAGQLDHREAENVEHQHRPPSVAIGQHAKEQRAHRPESLCEKHRAQNRPTAWSGTRLQSPSRKRSAEKIEAVQRPAKKGSDERVALRRGQALEVADKRH